MRIQTRKASLQILLAFLLFQPWLAAQKSTGTELRVDSLNKAFNNYLSSDLAQAEKIATEALELAVQAGYAFGEANARSNLSAYYLKKENYTKSIEAGLTALKIYDTKEMYKNTFEYGNTFIRIAKSFFMETDYTRSRAYGHQAIVVAQKIRDQHLLALGYEHLGNNFSMTLDVDSTLYYYNKAKKGFIKTNYIPGLANVANNTGAMYSDKGDHQEAIKYFREALSVYQKNNINASLTTGHYNMGFTYYALKSYSNALYYADSAAYYAMQSKRPTSLLKAYILKAQAYAGLRNVDSSAGYYEKSLALKDSIQSDTYKKELAALQTQSDVYKKETENQLLTKDKRIAVLYRNLAIAAIAGLVVILGFILLNQRLRIQRRVKDKLEEEVALRTKEISRQKEIIFHTNLRLKLALNGAKFDSHFAADTLNTIQQIVLNRTSAEAQRYLAKLSTLMQYVLEKSPLERVPLEKELEMLEHYIQLEQLRLNHCFDYSITVKGNEGSTIPALLLQPFVENIIQQDFASVGGEKLKLELQAETAGDVLIIVITDNSANKKKDKSNKQPYQGNTMGKERLDLLTHLTHKNHLVYFEDLTSVNNNISGTKVVLQIPKVGQTIPEDIEQEEAALERIV